MSKVLELSPELQERANAVIADPHYSGPDLGLKAIVAIEAPFGVGKSTITDKAISMLAERGIKAGVVGSTTTRDHRPNDPKNYTTEVNPETIIERAERGEMINVTQSPTGHLYATSFESVPYDVNIGPFLPDALAKLKLAKFGIVKSFYLVTTPEQWQKQLDMDQRLSQPDAARRIEEAENSLEYAIDKLAHRDGLPLQLIVNDGSREIDQLAGYLLYATGYTEFAPYINKNVSVDKGKQLLHQMYNYATMLQPDDKAA